MSRLLLKQLSHKSFSPSVMVQLNRAATLGM
jgi:hypothetical protein